MFTFPRLRYWALSALSICAVPLAAQTSIELPKVTPLVYDGDVRRLPQTLVRAPGLRVQKPEYGIPPTKDWADPVQPSAAVVPSINAPMPATSANFPGLSFDSPVVGGTAGSGYPPDTNGDVGPNHYILGVNDSYAIYDKATGTQLAAFTENQLWIGGGANVCNGNSFGDPIVLYDAFADRWILTHFAFILSGGTTTVAPVMQCIAVSKTNDPVSGGWYLYPIRTDPGGAGLPPVASLADYPKYGVWSDCLYMGANVFNAAGTAYLSPLYMSFSKADMYNGAPLTYSMIYPGTSTIFSSFPAHASGKTTNARPPAGRPGLFVSESSTAFAFELRTFTPGANCGGGGTLSAVTSAVHPSYTFVSTVPQSGTTRQIDTLTDRVMQRVYYRKVGSAESLWVTNTGAASSFARVHWAQLDVTGGVLPTTFVQRQLFGDTTIHRFMGSIAADNQGNMALGYSTSSTTTFPAIKYSGRLAGDALNTLPQTETTLIVGTGSQTGTSRWGDYASMSVDPVDDCTFWFASEYYAVSGNNWNTRIGSFKFPTCTAPTAGSDLVIAKSHTGNFTPGQTGAQYTITVTNNGNAPTLGTVTVTDTLPAGLTATAISGSGWTCTQPSGPCMRSDVLNNGSSYPALTLTVNVAANASGTLTNSAAVSGGADMVYTNNSASDPTTIGAAAPPTVTSFKVLFGSKEYELIGSPRNRLPWTVTGVKVTFSAPITTGNSNSLTGLMPTGFSGLGTSTLTWTVNPVNLGLVASSLLGTGPNALKDGAGTAITTYNQNVKALYGDFNDDGFVNATDLSGVNAARALPYNILADINGNNVVDLTDVTIVRSRIGTSLP